MTTRILMLEDDEGLAGSVIRALDVRGYAVVWAKTIDEAMEIWARDRDFALILCDYELPDGVGLSFLQLVDGYNQDGGPKTILWSGLDRTKEAGRAGVVPDRILVKSASIEAMSAIDELTGHDD